MLQLLRTKMRSTGKGARLGLQSLLGHKTAGKSLQRLLANGFARERARWWRQEVQSLRGSEWLPTRRSRVRRHRPSQRKRGRRFSVSSHFPETPEGAEPPHTSRLVPARAPHPLSHSGNIWEGSFPLRLILNYILAAVR